MLEAQSSRLLALNLQRARGLLTLESVPIIASLLLLNINVFLLHNALTVYSRHQHVMCEIFPYDKPLKSSLWEI